MAVFHLQIVTPDGLMFDGNAEEVIIRTETGDVGIRARHIDFVSSIAIGRARIKEEGASSYREGCASGGMIIMLNGECRIVPTTFEWEDMIDINRAKKAREKAEALIKSAKTDKELKLAELKLKRALLRIDVSSKIS